MHSKSLILPPEQEPCNLATLDEALSLLTSVSTLNLRLMDVVTFSQRTQPHSRQILAETVNLKVIIDSIDNSYKVKVPSIRKLQFGEADKWVLRRLTDRVTDKIYRKNVFYNKYRKYLPAGKLLHGQILSSFRSLIRLVESQQVRNLSEFTRLVDYIQLQNVALWEHLITLLVNSNVVESKDEILKQIPKDQCPKHSDLNGVTDRSSSLDVAQFVREDIMTSDNYAISVTGVLKEKTNTSSSLPKSNTTSAYPPELFSADDDTHLKVFKVRLQRKPSEQSTRRYKIAVATSQITNSRQVSPASSVSNLSVDSRTSQTKAKDGGRQASQRPSPKLIKTTITRQTVKTQSRNPIRTKNQTTQTSFVPVMKVAVNEILELALKEAIQKAGTNQSQEKNPQRRRLPTSKKQKSQFGGPNKKLNAPKGKITSPSLSPTNRGSYTVSPSLFGFNLEATKSLPISSLSRAIQQNNSYANQQVPGETMASVGASVKLLNSTCAPKQSKQSLTCNSYRLFASLKASQKELVIPSLDQKWRYKGGCQRTSSKLQNQLLDPTDDPKLNSTRPFGKLINLLCKPRKPGQITTPAFYTGGRTPKDRPVPDPSIAQSLNDSFSAGSLANLTGFAARTKFPAQKLRKKITFQRDDGKMFNVYDTIQRKCL